MLNKTTLIGNVGQDPEIKTMQSGDRVANFTIATSETWKDKATGERKEKTEWHKIVIYNQSLIKMLENYVKKGMKLYIEGQNATRSWDKDGQKFYVTEIVLKEYRGEIKFLSFVDKEKQDDTMPEQKTDYKVDDDFDQNIPF